MNVYDFRRCTSAASTYLPISRSNCAKLVQGRYSSNSCAIRFPAPGINTISAAVAVFRFTCTKAFLNRSVI